MGGKTLHKDRLGPHVVQLRMEVPQLDVVADISLVPRGLHAFTGESGTGKTLILEAIKIITGHPVKRWKNLEEYSLHATVYYPEAARRFADMGVKVEDVFVVSVQKVGRTIYRINGIPVAREQVWSVLSSLAVFASSDERYRLGQSGYRLAFVDAGVSPEILKGVRKLYGEILAVQRQLEVLGGDINRLKDSLLEDDLWDEAQRLWQWISRYDELKELLDAYEKRQHLEELFRDILMLLSEDRGLLGDLRRLERLVSETGLSTDGIEKFWDWIWVVKEEVEARLGAEDLPEDLPEIVWRIERLARKAGLYPDELPGFLEKEREKRDRLGLLLEERNSLNQRIVELRSRFEKLSDILYRERLKAAERLSAGVNAYMSHLFTGDIRFGVDVVRVDAIDFRLGSDVMFFIERLGKKLKPSEMLSSGELSRFVLSLYLASEIVTPVLVFDEIDTGISGETAKKVARLLKDMGAKGQVIVATHSHFVAAASDVQFSWQNGKWVRLSEEQRVAEIARLLGTSSEIARELIQYFRGKG